MHVERGRTLTLASASFLALGLALVASAADAQMTRSVLESIPVSTVFNPPHSFNISRNFQTTGELDYQTIYDWATHWYNENSNDLANLLYAGYGGPAGSTLVITPVFSDPISPPNLNSNPQTDACHHSHLESAAYGFGTRAVNLGTTTIYIPFLRFLGSTGEMGKRYDASFNQVKDLTPGASCYVNSDTDIHYPMNNGTFIWGSGSHTVTLGMQNGLNVQWAMVVAQSATHGWGSCGHFTCFPGVTMYAYRLQ